jgi:hypothetical protein
VEDLARGRGEVARLLEVARQRGPRRAGAGGAGAGRAAGGAAAGDAEGVLEVPLPVRAGNRRFGRLSSLRTYTKAPYNLLTCYGINAKGAEPTRAGVDRQGGVGSAAGEEGVPRG